MARGNSGRIVVEIDPEAKHRLYEALAKEGITLKKWFSEAASEYCEHQKQPFLILQDSPPNPKDQK